MIAAVKPCWERFWFAPKGPTMLSVCRLLFFGLLFWNYFDERFAPWAEVSRAFWQPIWVFEKFRIPVLSAEALFACEIVWKVSLALASVGLLTRFSTATAFLLGIYLLGLRHNFGKVSHDDAAPVWIMLILALSRCGDALSLDAILRRKRVATTAAPSAEKLPLESGEYRWPLRAVWLVLSMVFFNSAIAKLRRSGLEWALSENLSVLMVRLNYFNKPTTDWGLHLANIRGFGQLMGVGALAIELFFPLVLFSRIARWTLVPGAFLMQLGNKFLLGVDFTVFMFAYVFFIDWGWLLKRMRKRDPFFAVAGTPGRGQDREAGGAAHQAPVDSTTAPT
ncbi:MAG TPA: hypothetical protein VGR35_03045 [Tepidisphaeraceae bacterium]|nr:hypothetical protein [Tepidisphaeraceae bacterium]